MAEIQVFGIVSEQKRMPEGIPNKISLELGCFYRNADKVKSVLKPWLRNSNIEMTLSYYGSEVTNCPVEAGKKYLVTFTDVT